MKIYTKTGDDGTTGLLGWQRIGKSDHRIDCFGAIDELNATLGWCAVAAANVEPLASLLRQIQSDLFTLGSHLAVAEGSGADRNLPPLDAKAFLQLSKERQKLVEFDAKLVNRSLNEGFSGGEKKRNEIFQLAMLEPSLSILDETDSGLDIDALRIVAKGVNKLRSQQNAFLIITHYQRLLEYIVPDFVHVLYDGRIVKSGTKELALELEEKGYDWLKEKEEVGTI